MTNKPTNNDDVFFGRDCRWTEGFDEWGNPKNRRSKTFNNNKINL